MTDRWTERLSEYLDGELSSAERLELEQHLESCFECKRVLSELHEVVNRARELPDAAPAQDLWAGIAAQIGQRPVQLGDLKVIDLRERKAIKTSRRFAFTMPQLAAAAIALMVLSGSVVWALLRQSAPQLATQEASAPVAQVRQVGSTTAPAAPLNDYADAVHQLETTLEQNRMQLDPVTVAILEENLRTIDAAITEARVALERDPGNLYLNQHLENTMKKKIQLLRRANAIKATAI